MRKKFYILGIVCLFFLIIIGVSYAIWQITLQQTNENVITTGCFQIEFSGINSINLEKAYPIMDEEGKKLTPYEFIITNTCNSFASYQINLEILNATTLENLNYLKVMLDDKVNILTSNDEVNKTLENAKTSYKLQTGYLRENGSKTFSLRIWMDENTPTREEFMNKLFESKITVIATYKENLDNNIEANAVSQNESFSDQETFQIHVTSEKYDLVSISDNLETWEELETKGKDITVEKTVTKNGSHTFYFQDEAGNVQEVTVTATKIDDKKPTANMSVTKTDDGININANSSFDNESRISKYYYSKDGVNFVSSNESSYTFVKGNVEYGRATDSIAKLYTSKVNVVYVKVEDEAGNQSELKKEIVGDLVYDETVDNNLRFIGENPDNYIDIGDRDAAGNVIPWRIIGSFNNIDDGTGTKESRIKLVRSESIGMYSWDTSESSVNTGEGVNEWSQADVMKLLNSGYESESVGGSLYWNKKTGTCYNGKNNATTACDFSSNGLSNTAKTLVGDVLWNTGGQLHSFSTMVNDFYNQERGTNTGKNCSMAYSTCNDTVDRKITWIGTVGLIYPSDYGYATSGGSTMSRENCLNESLNLWNNMNASDCLKNNWIKYESTMMPYSAAEYYHHAFNVMVMSANGYMVESSASNSSSVYPTMYLLSSVKIKSGVGSSDNMFVASLN